MKKDPPPNIFEAASQDARSKKRLTPNVAPQSAPPPTSKEDVLEKATLLSKGEIDNMLSKMQQLRKDLEEKLEAIYVVGQLTPQKIDQYLDLFSDLVDTKSNEADKKDLEDKIWSVMGASAKTQKAKEDISKDTKVRKGKSLGARKKWLPMR